MQAICNKLFLFITFDMYFIRTTYSGRKGGESEEKRKGRGGGEGGGGRRIMGLCYFLRNIRFISHISFSWTHSTLLKTEYPNVQDMES